MAKAALAGSIAALLLSSLQTASAVVCINVQDIVDTTPNRDGTAITFKMRGGKVWENKLLSPCPQLRYYGFSWVLPGPTQVCDRQQSIRVIQSGEVCELGDFTDVTPSVVKKH